MSSKTEMAVAIVILILAKWSAGIVIWKTTPEPAVVDNDLADSQGPTTTPLPPPQVPSKVADLTMPAESTTSGILW